jgi:hypothetical protein
MRVPVVGNVTAVFPVTVPAKVKAPEKVTLPPMVMVLEPLLTPVPPYCAAIVVACQVPDAIVPRAVIVADSVVLTLVIQDTTPEPFVP